MVLLGGARSRVRGDGAQGWCCLLLKCHILFASLSATVRVLRDDRNGVTIGGFRLLKGSPRVSAKCDYRLRRSYHAT